MGWYDSFKGDTAKASQSAINALSKSSAMQNLGDAFSGVGKVMSDADAQKKRDKYLTEQTKDLELKNAFSNDTLNTRVQTTKDEGILKGVDATIATQTKQNKIDQSGYETNDARLQNDFNSKTFDTRVQTVNDTGAITSANADIATQTKQNKIDQSKYEADNSKLQNSFNNDTLATRVETVKDTGAITSANADIATQTKNAKIKDANLQPDLTQMKIETAKISNENKGFKYSQDTDTKIANIISKAMGIDNLQLEALDKDKQKEYLDTVTAVARISKEYNLTPLLAIKIHREQQAKDTPVVKNNDPLGLRK